MFLVVSTNRSKSLSQDVIIRQEASDLVSLMTPVVKSFFTEMGMEITSDAMQIHEDTDILKTKELNNYIEIIELHQFMKE